MIDYEYIVYARDGILHEENIGMIPPFH